VDVARVGAVLGAGLLVLSGCSSSPKTFKNLIQSLDDRGPAASVKSDNERKPAPDFALKDANGQTVHLSDYRGKVVLLDFWATWCGPCQIEIPWFKDFERQHKDKGFAVLGVAMDDEGWEVVKPFAQQSGINYRLLIFNDSVEKAYGGLFVDEETGRPAKALRALPTTFLIDREGRIASVHVGLAGKRDFEDGIQELLQASRKPSGKSSVPALLVRAE
jgi:peroxiredoxin